MYPLGQGDRKENDALRTSRIGFLTPTTEVLKPSCARDRGGGEDVCGHGQQPPPAPQVPGQYPSSRRKQR